MLSDALSLHPLCEGSLGDWSAWGVGVAGEMRREKKGKIFFRNACRNQKNVYLCSPVQRSRFFRQGFRGLSSRPVGVVTDRGSLTHWHQEEKHFRKGNIQTEFNSRVSGDGGRAEGRGRRN